MLKTLRAAAQFLNRHRFIVERLEIYDMIADKYYARLYYRKGSRHYWLEIRPSDGLALAVRLGTPIFVPDRIIEAHLNTNHFFEGDKRYPGDVSLFDDFAV